MRENESGFGNAIPASSAPRRFTGTQGVENDPMGKGQEGRGLVCKKEN
jgi:hypothetical protein